MESKKLKHLIKAGDEAIDRGEPKTALKLLSEALAIDPENLDAHFYLGRANIHANRLKAAEKHVRLVLKKAPETYSIHLNLGVIKARQGNESAAVRLYKRELKKNPECREAHYNLAVVYYYRKQWKKSFAHYEFCWQQRHQGNELEERFAFVAHKLGRYDIEKEVYQRILRTDPDNVYALNNLAACLNHNGDHTAALRRLKKAAELSPKDQIVQDNLADTIKLVAKSKLKTIRR